MKEKKLILIALTINHHSLYLSLIKFLLKAHDNITVLSRKDNTDIFKKSNLSKNVNFIFETGETTDIIIKNMKFINSFDTLIIDEVYGKYYKLYKLKFKNQRKISIIHNSNKWVLNKLKLHLKHIIIAYIKKLYFQQFDAYITMGPNVKLYLAEFTNKEVFFFPFDDYSEKNMETIKPNSNKVDIVIPGRVTSDRRNNNGLITFLDHYYSNNPNSLIRIKLLGKFSKSKNNEATRKLINGLNHKYGKKIFFWDNFIPPEEFESELISSDFILSNLNMINNLNDRVEIYGLTKESGISFAIFKYAKPAIIPDTQQILSGFANQFVTYNSFDQLTEIFSRIENGRISIEKLKNNSIENSKAFQELSKKEKNRIDKYLN